jgi:hemerythrin-like domain-containing protein
MMDIVHSALRRDLDRARKAVTSDPLPTGRRRRAIGQHVVWLMDFLHGHHTGEDEGLWPMVLARDPSTASLLSSLEADHARIAPAVDAVTTAAHDYTTTTSDDARVALITALDALADVLFPHLDREVEEAMPVVSATISDDDWQAWDQAANLKGKSKLRLGMEGHFLLDGTDTEGRGVVVHLVPPVPRFVLIHGLGWLYRRQCRRRWGPQQAVPAGAAGA